MLEDPTQEPPEEAFAWTKSWKDAPDEPGYLKIGFEKGLPVSVNGEKLSPAALIARRSARVAGQHGVGRIDLMEDRVVGIKSRETYECPAADGADRRAPGPGALHHAGRRAAGEGAARPALRASSSTKGFWSQPAAARAPGLQRRARARP